MFILTIFFSLFWCSQLSAQPIRLVSYNMRYDWRDDWPPWNARKEHVANEILKSGGQIVGLQEGLHYMLFDEGGLLDLLKDGGYSYLPQGEEGGIVGVGRDDGKEKGEYVAIVYKLDEYELLDFGNFWLCSVEEEGEPGCKHPDAQDIRMCVWGLFQSKEYEDLRFYVFSTHLDHKGLEARKDAAIIIKNKIEELTKENEEVLPVFLVGDMNSVPTDESIDTFKSLGMIDTFDVVDEQPEIPFTMHRDDTLKKFLCNDVDRRIDYIFFLDDREIVPNHLFHSNFCYQYDGDEKQDLDNWFWNWWWNWRKKWLWWNPSDHLMVVGDLFFEGGEFRLSDWDGIPTFPSLDSTPLLSSSEPPNDSTGWVVFVGVGVGVVVLVLVVAGTVRFFVSRKQEYNSMP